MYDRLWPCLRGSRREYDEVHGERPVLFQRGLLRTETSAATRFLFREMEDVS